MGFLNKLKTTALNAKALWLEYTQSGVFIGLGMAAAAKGIDVQAGVGVIEQVWALVSTNGYIQLMGLVAVGKAVREHLSGLYSAIRNR